MFIEAEMGGMCPSLRAAPNLSSICRLYICLAALQVLVVVFGQELPDATASVIDQTFSLVVAFVGLGAFALVLALIEQVVLEVRRTTI